ncbi:translation elongation factor Ts [Ectothiorhodospira variabilis]|uniref:translation elongation factor Ts n=1 Tax=Ectothiorhodospira variabilis TaxID=505694 RepID=UPI001EFA3527|nr:translation elongation factor Ts [Ectothiorhodospira variabilis]MCG5493908.1 translation elongation factor Ts [Ectothiorhodospira variabilis]MCG5498122.1 translation elongation factor Ts [Ectothiorhodospira variabilis]MCG5503711.1 translation elongation factor Ts [Ectothiorhodospira variabilis]MCG5506867.1 translation elongation factor Ts [Ectothiorhodospira variabilis]
MQITASMVKELRETTGAGMMECKKALTAANGDMEAAIEQMRKSGAAKAVKKADRVAAEGQVMVASSDDHRRAVIVEVNCETDFVAKDENFNSFVTQIAEQALAQQPADVDALMALSGAEGSLEETRAALVAKIGENVQVRRFELFASEDGELAHYLHGTRIGVVVEMVGGNQDLARDVAMHIAASHPVCVDESQVPQDLLKKEEAVFRAQAEESGKPAEIIDKMITGRIKKYLGEVTLLGQPFVKDPDQTVGQMLKAAGAQVRQFARFEVGEGIEKKTENFAEEVMAQAKGS